MIPSRYMLIDEKSTYPVKRRVRGRRDGNHEPAITLLPPDPYLIMEKPNFDRLPSPTMYRTAPPKSAKNKEASSFVILGETIHTPVQSRPGSPSGRVSPFRGHGFKSPNVTRPNSRTVSPLNSPRKSLPKPDKPKISKDIGLPPKSPKSKKPKPLSVVKPDAKAKEAVGGNEAESVNGKKTQSTEEEQGSKVEEAETPQTMKGSETSEVVKEGETQVVAEEVQKTKTPKKEQKPELKAKPPKSKKPPMSPMPTNKPKAEKIEENSVIKKATKPPVPPKKIGMKATLKVEEVLKQMEPGKVRGPAQSSKIKEPEQPKPVEKTEMKESEKKEEKEESKKENVKEKEKEQKKRENEQKKEEKKDEKEEKKEEEKKGEKEKKEQKLVPCFQPDKCQIAPPTMASPSPIITPSISTPSTSADLASSSTKNSQSISAAPTTVTPSSFSSVSSTVVLSGNLARKEIEHRAKGTEVKVAPADAPKHPPKASVHTLKAQSKDSILQSKKDNNPSKEITSTTKVIKAEPEMEVLSPNNLRDSPPRAPPPNVAWEDERLPNGDVPNKVESEGKFRRFISAAWNFLSYLIYCGCLKKFRWCKRQQPALGPPAPPKPSLLSRLNCFKGRSCPNPFKRCFDRCLSKCCEKLKCCRGKSKSKSKPRKCCAKSKCCSLKGCCDRCKNRCLGCRDKVYSCCRSLFCLNMMCCQRFLRKFKFCHKFKCCQKDGFCSCCNPNVKEARKLNKKGSRGSNNSRDKDNLDVVLVEHTSLMKAAIPVLPSCLAVFCLICNLFVPGFGTLISGLLCLCFGKPRFSVKDTPKNRMGSFIVNTIIAVAQLFTVVFCLVGWGWSIWWGVIMYKLSRRQKRLKLAEKNQKEAEGSNVNHNHVDVEQG